MTKQKISKLLADEETKRKSQQLTQGNYPMIITIQTSYNLAKFMCAIYTSNSLNTGTILPDMYS